MDEQSPQHNGEQRAVDLLWLLLCGLLASWYCTVAAHKLGATFDEPFYISAGLERWHTGSYEQLLRAGTMPLPVDVQTLPVYLYETWQGIRFDPVADLDAILPYARLGTLVFVWLLLIYGRLIGRALAGPWGGRLAIAFLALEPSILGHSSLATTDISITACLLPFAYHYWKNRDAARWIWRVGLPALWLGIAMLAKASALAFGPICMLVIECQRLHARGAFQTEAAATLWTRLRHAARILRPWFWQASAIGWLAVAVTFLYCGSDWRAEPSFVAWADKLPAGVMRNNTLWVAEHLRVFPNAGSGLMRQVRHNLQGHLVYLVGLEHNRSLWFYFPLLLTIKLTLPLLILTALLLITRPRALTNWAFLCFAVLLAFSLTFRVQIGIRMVLPVVALGMVGLAAALVNTVRAYGYSWKRVALGSLTLSCLAWTAVATSRQHPHGLCYTNDLWGGTRDGYHFVSDANYDWGQGLKDLHRWQQRNHVANLDVWYFGTDPLLKELPIASAPFSLWKVQSDAEFHAKVQGRFLAVSTTNLYGSYAPDAEIPRRILRPMRPVARTQTFLIYDFRDPHPLAAAPTRP